MSVYELCELYIDESEEMTIWSNESEQVVFEGTFKEAATSQYADELIGSFGIEYGKICINIR